MKTLEFKIKRIVPIMEQTYRGRWYKVWFTIEATKRNGYLEFTMHGVEGPIRTGGCLAGFGQIDMHLKEENREEWKYCKGYTSDILDKLFDIWDKYHLKNIEKQPLTDEEVDFLNGLQDLSNDYPW